MENCTLAACQRRLDLQPACVLSPPQTDRVKQHSKAKWLPLRTQKHTHTHTPQWKRGFPPPPPQHKSLCDQRSDTQWPSHWGRRGENTRIHIYNPARPTHTHTHSEHYAAHIGNMRLSMLTRKTCRHVFSSGGRRGRRAADAGRVRRDMRSAARNCFRSQYTYCSGEQPWTHQTTRHVSRKEEKSIFLWTPSHSSSTVVVGLTRDELPVWLTTKTTIEWPLHFWIKSYNIFEILFFIFFLLVVKITLYITSSFRTLPELEEATALAYVID